MNSRFIISSALALAVALATHAQEASPSVTPALKATESNGLYTNIEYGKAGDEKLLLDASVPKGIGPFPMAIVVHGGGWGSGDKQQDVAPMTEPLTKANYTWFSINYRLPADAR